MVVAIKDILKTIEDRVELNRPDVRSQAYVMGVSGDWEYLVYCVIDPTMLDDGMGEDVMAFNDEAMNTITYIDGKLINNGSDNSLFVLMFNVSKCNGGL